MRGRGRLLILVGLIILLGVVGVVVLLPQIQGSQGGGGQATRPPEVTAAPTATPIQLVEIVVAIQELPRGLRIPPVDPNNPEAGAVRIERWPVESAPFNAYTNIEDVVGKIARTDIPRGAPILSTMLVDSLLDMSDIGSDAAAVMPPGRVAVALPMDRLTGVAYALREGDYVDVIMSFLFVDIDEEFQSILPNTITLISFDEQGNVVPGASGIEGRLDVGLGGSPVVVGPSEDQRPRLLTQRTVQAAWVLRVGDFPLEGGYIGNTPTPRPSPTPADQQQQQGEQRPVAAPTPLPPPNIITLAVTPQDALVLVWAIESRFPITLALRAATDISQIPTQPVTLQYIMSNYNISVPERLPYSLEPPIRSIRQLMLSDDFLIRPGGGTQQ